VKDENRGLLEAIARVGRHNPSSPDLRAVDVFRPYFDNGGHLDRELLDNRDGSCTRRELLLRYLLLSAVIDQGPDIVGVRRLLVDVTNALYRREVRFLHRPIDFFKELGIGIDAIVEKHKGIKALRADEWAAENDSNPRKYNLFMDNSHQALNFAIFRWGVPLAVPHLLEKDCKDDEARAEVLLRHLQSFISAEEMSQQLKGHERYGLGKAIGDKACHLFAKWMVSTFEISTRTDPGWGPFGFESPYDSNAGRVLWRTGYLLRLATEGEFERRDVIQRGGGKGGKHYIRVTNMRGMKASKPMASSIRDAYETVCRDHLRSHKRAPKNLEIQRVQHAYLFRSFGKNGLNVANFDDGLIRIGTKYCYNLANPDCTSCPLRRKCVGHLSTRRLITAFRT